MCIANKINASGGSYQAPSSLFAAIPPAAAQTAPRRRKLWEIHTRYHCPIIGTCLTVDELRRLARRADLEDWDTGSDYELHSAAVGLARDRNALSELVQKEMERKFAALVQRFARARSDDDILPLWRAALARGEIAAALWAVMSHGRASDKLMHVAYEEVHMISHQVGTASRADLRKLARLAEDNADLAARLSRQQDNFARQLAEKEALIHALNERLAEALGTERRLLDAGESRREAAGSDETARQAQRIAELERRLEAESARAEQAGKSGLEATARADRLERVAADLRQDLDAAEETLGGLLMPASCGGCDEGQDGRCAGPDFTGRCVLCVGGRTGLAEHYRQLVERSNGRFVHHDGGLEDSRKRLPAMLAAADAVICPADNVSHAAYYAVKRLCKQYGKPCVLLNNSGLSSFARGLAALDSESDR
ncbi:MAG: DUF2325 domain-containing protein [Sulfuricella sp.]|nr:DUF2325 domain-containing protein [Sulfuricella sp.]